MAVLSRRGMFLAAAGTLAACSGPRPKKAPPFTGKATFLHGVASGDPRVDRIVIWTRVTLQGGGPAPVRWIVAKDRRLRNVIRYGDVVTGPERDYTVKVDVDGLKPNQKIYYGFSIGAARSPVGKASTLPRGGLSKLTIGVASCASHPHGFFNAYEAMAKRKDLDVIVHLGDYIYEYGLSGFGGDSALQLGRLPQPEIECVTVSDYRARHAQYKAEPELQAAHAACPWIVTWDDHEVANDSWVGGAENHNPEQNEGAWAARREAALQAYYEWMPIRDPEPGQPFAAINRSFQFGDLATLVMLETRLLARSQPLSYARDLQLASTWWEFSNPAFPRALQPNETPTPLARRLPTPFEMIDGQLRPILDWTRARSIDPRNPPLGIMFMPDLDGFKSRTLADETRMLLGPAQEGWLKAELQTSRKQRTTWQVLGNQTLMAKINAPDLSNLPAPVVATLEKLQPGVSRLLPLTRFNPPLSLDSWDGYPAQRTRLYAMIAEAEANTVVITGDSHSAWANELISDDGKARAGVEFGVTSITSPGFGDWFDGADIDFAQVMPKTNPQVKWHDAAHRGYMVLTLTKTDAKADFYIVSDVRTKQFTVAKTASFSVRSDDRGKTGALTPDQ